MDRAQPYLIPLRVSDEAIRKQVKIYYPRDDRRMRKYVVEVDRKDPRIKGIMKGLEGIVENKVIEVKERLYGCDVFDVKEEVRVSVSPNIPNYLDLLELANKNIKPFSTTKPKKIQRNFKNSPFDKKAEIGSLNVRINCGLVFFTCRNCQEYFLASSIFSPGRLNSIACSSSTLEKFNNLFHCEKCNIQKLNYYYF